MILYLCVYVCGHPYEWSKNNGARHSPFNKVSKVDSVGKPLEIDFNTNWSKLTKPSHHITSFLIRVVSSTPVYRSCNSTLSGWN